MGYILPEQIIYREIEPFQKQRLGEYPDLPRAVYEKRLRLLRERMAERKLDVLVFYADREHYSNFRYYAAFEPRFEEGILVIHITGENYVLLGNECFGLHKESKIPIKPLLCQVLSLPNQPMEKFCSMEKSLTEAGILKGMQVGVIGWKIFEGFTGNEEYFDIPSYMVEALRVITGRENVKNGTGILLHPDGGIRTINDVHTIAQLEYGAAQASRRVGELLEHLEPGKTEEELGAYLNPRGRVMSCHPLITTGKNRYRGLISASNRKVRLGEAFNISMGLEGGLSCRAGYVAENERDLKEEEQDYLDVLAKPYYAAAVTWYENVGIGTSGGDLYRLIQNIFPKEKYGWVLNPGHFIGTEEWLSSPFYEKSTVKLQSGMLLQMDIIPDLKGYSAPNAEDGICLADKNLQQELQEIYPETWNRMEARRRYMYQTLGIALKPEVFPMSDLAAVYNPFILSRKKAFCVKPVI